MRGPDGPCLAALHISDAIFGAKYQLEAAELVEWTVVKAEAVGEGFEEKSFFCLRGLCVARHGVCCVLQLR